jgi:hypothetical protein
MSTLLGDALFGGQSRTDRKQITDLYKTLGPAAESAIPQGLSAEGDALSYFRGITSGNRQLEAEAAAPAVNAVSAQNEAEKQRLSSEGTGRGGGVNAAQQATGDAATKASVDVLTNLAPQAATAEAGIGGAVTGQGLSAASEQGSLATTARATDLAHQTAEGADVGKLASAALGVGGGVGFLPTDITSAPTSASGVMGTVPGTDPANEDWMKALQEQAPELFA